MRASSGTQNDVRLTDPIIPERDTDSALARAFSNVLAVSPQLSLLPPLKFVVPASPRIFVIPHDQIQTYHELKRVVANKLEIDLEAVQDMYGDCIDEEAWSVIAFSWPYYLGKFTVIGAPQASAYLLTVEFKPKRLAMKFAVPRPHNLTVRELVGILVKYMRQLQAAAGPAHIEFLPSDFATLYIEGATSGELVQGLAPKRPRCLRLPEPRPLTSKTKTLATAHSSPCRRRVGTQWTRLPNIRQPSQDILMASATTIWQVKSFIERWFFMFMHVHHEDLKDKILVQHDVVVRIDDGHWTEVPDPDETTLGSLQQPVRSVIRYRDNWPVDI
ncbi:hypothetical protein FN846DRAFT_909973 [Sphaerosporella brunnea]|uniref:Ubiquitin-like domain-containing protein n=1 Tax=Sphaerosporella brunnea TaxID=1250544 RepID=A0A5J5EPC8_9PEZI|nr:hypothetical protein FN846DRAFT_909973 [Sphaerosporella brunnea]